MLEISGSANTYEYFPDLRLFVKRVMSVRYGALTSELTTPKVQYGALSEELKEDAKAQEFITMKTYRLSAHERQSGIYRGTARMCIPSVIPPRNDV